MSAGPKTNGGEAKISRRRLFEIGAMAVTASVSRGAASKEASGTVPRAAMNSLLIRGGLVATAKGRRPVDVLVRGEKIVEIGPNL
jgi:hypothetical protein